MAPEKKKKQILTNQRVNSSIVGYFFKQLQLSDFCGTFVLYKDRHS